MQLGYRRATPLQRGPYFLHLKGGDDVALLEVGESIERDTAIETFADFLGVILEALETVESAFPNDVFAAPQAYERVATHDTVRNHATGDDTSLGDLEDLANLGFADRLFDELRSQQALHRGQHVVDGVVDDR